ncbi:endoribonuclease L-PSP [Cupriavidus sp. SK-4]|uniref:RidA family protein n=1 Tax=Cupriavidus sp. SK-4 TaxID=574750 RepID=UPI00044D23C2|nr:RidA family protein [Cupriavidus sp. SK-4]EYS86295.1 endoribonuclease L-PSP [Cupriavidus sp. SK-4]
MSIQVFESLKGNTPEQRLAELDIQLPEVRKPVGNYTGAVTTGNLVFVAGHGTFVGPRQTHKGKLGADVSVEQGRDGARTAVTSALASLKAEIGELSRVRRVVRLFGMVNSAPDFERQPEVIDGASDVLTSVFGPAGVHARCAVGFAALPFGMPIELEMVVEIA